MNPFWIITLKTLCERLMKLVTLIYFFFGQHFDIVKMSKVKEILGQGWYDILVYRQSKYGWFLDRLVYERARSINHF